ncbi:aminoglycoside 3'-phosphotransferase [Paenibacillus sp. XY044]|uniref:aminoglycoside 3'-phosphotransferase n=1 Tax=Paenibacillus sp. XY044 TaxID=2026089 RepID=UPI000B98BEC4|nr:aminoglycoside 3'-phosphotransferase [Paenibacillus sp. XY044]OZB94341.1 aminoglycoside phosphotransferase [Paenibacillus sp. XY044]
MSRQKTYVDIESIPAAVRPFLTNAVFYDSSCSGQAQTLRVEGAERFFLKISGKGRLEREYRMTDFLHSHQLAPRAIAFASDEGHDYLLTEPVPGENGASPTFLEQPARLAKVFGEQLRMLHSLPLHGCPYPGRTREMLQDAGIALPDLDEALKPFRYTPSDDVIIHGDYCLPNIMLDSFGFRGFIDLGDGGIGDRHYDLYYGLWTLNYNLKTDRYHDTFLDAYGRQHVDPEGLAYFTRWIEMLD